MESLHVFSCTTIALGEDFRIGFAECEPVTWDVDLRDDFDVACSSVGDDFFDVGLGVKSAVFGVVDPFLFLVAFWGVDGSAFTVPCADGGELGVGFDFDSPAFVIGEVPVEFVHLMHGHGVDEMFDEFFAKEVAGFVEHQSSPCKAGHV